MVELTRTDVVVHLSWLQMRLAEGGIKAVIFDTHTGGAYGFALAAVQQRVMVDEADLFRARRILEEAPAS